MILTWDSVGGMCLDLIVLIDTSCVLGTVLAHCRLCMIGNKSNIIYYV